MTEAKEKNSLLRAVKGEERLWKVWWLWGMPVGLGASALTLAAEALREALYYGSGDAVDVLKFLLYLIWFSAAWRCSGNVNHRIWTFVSRLAIALGLGVAAITF
jgi:hypothetical protein